MLTQGSNLYGWQLVIQLCVAHFLAWGSTVTIAVTPAERPAQVQNIPPVCCLNALPQQLSGIFLSTGLLHTFISRLSLWSPCN